jgi:hypothetical protein
MYSRVLTLMWSGNSSEVWIAKLAVTITYLMTFFVALVLLAWGIVYPRQSTHRHAAFLKWCHDFAPCWVLLIVLSTSLGRIIANIIYALAPWAAPDITPSLARIEGPVLEILQSTLETPWTGSFSSGIYSWVWSCTILSFGPFLILQRQRRAVSQLILGAVLLPLLAVPLYLLLPAFDPWATNPLYGYSGPGQTTVRYLYPQADLATLKSVATSWRWVTGSCLPSLHVGLPFLYACLAWRNGLRRAAWLLGSVAALTSVAVLYLGRHWIADVVAAIPFVLIVYWIVLKLNVDLVLSSSSARRRLA